MINHEQLGAVPVRQVVRLRDGRALSYLELGAPSGVTVLFTMGSPSSAIGALGFDAAAERNGVRLVSIDKPGYGGSTRDPKRTLQRYGADVADLADVLGLDRVAVAGQSGGGPHAIAAAYVLGNRVSNLTLIASAGPLAEPWARSGLNPVMRTMTWFARNAPGLLGLPVAGMDLLMGNPARLERLAKRNEHKLSDAERALMHAPEMPLIAQGIQDAFASGRGGVKDEFRAIGRDWGFVLEDVTARTEMWHGTVDKSCPIAMARQLAARLPNVTLHELDGCGHNFFGADLDAVFASIARPVQPASPAP